VIVVDTSALVAVVLQEPMAEVCEQALATATEVVLSAGTLAEALIVAERRGVRIEMAALIDQFGMEIEPVSAATADRVADAHGRWGRGAGTAGLNFGDCFAYEAARSRRCALLYLGDDFAKTDVEGAIQRP
jgi:ribonuclease VapC